MAMFAALAAMEGPEQRRDNLTAARAGDLAAFEELMRRHERMVLGTALRLTGNMEDAKDVSQEVFLKLFRNLGKIDIAPAIAAWLYRVTVNASRDVQRKRRGVSPVELDEDLKAAEDDPHAGMAAAERRRALDLSLRMLPEKERAALVLRDLEGLSTGQVAQLLGSSEATVRSQISKGRVKVKDFMERYFRRRT